LKSKKNKLKSLLRQREYEQQQSLKEQKKEAKKILFAEAYNDPEKHEIVSRSTTNELLTEMGKKFDPVINCAVPDVEKGLILLNDYGHGLFQNNFAGGVN
jgi:hypothetical protein